MSTPLVVLLFIVLLAIVLIALARHITREFNRSCTEDDDSYGGSE